MEDTTLPPQDLPVEETIVNPADSTETVQNQGEETLPTLSLKEFNEALGKDFKSKDMLIKSIKDTFSYVGKKKEDIAKEISANKVSPDNSLAKELAEIKENLFYRDNPDYAPYKSVIAKLGSNPVSVINTPEFKEIFDKAKGFDENQKLKTVLETSSRVAVTRDRLSKAQDLKNNGQKEAFESEVTKAVMDLM